mgnify:CR=1 FL=1
MRSSDEGSFKIISVWKPSDTFKRRRKPIIQRFQLERSRPGGVDVPLMQQQRLLAAGPTLVSFLADLWFKELIRVQTYIGFGIKRTLCILHRIIHPMLELIFISCLLFFGRQRSHTDWSAVVFLRQFGPSRVQNWVLILVWDSRGEVLVSALVFGEIYLVLNRWYVVHVSAVSFDHRCIIRHVSFGRRQIIRSLRFAWCRVPFRRNVLVPVLVVLIIW